MLRKDPAPMTEHWKIDTTDATFETDVLERSDNTPVLVDFWATWCGPCRTLAPILEDAVRLRASQMVLVKADTDACQQAAMAFQVQSIPAVFLIFRREVVDSFAGVMDANALAQWLDNSLEKISVLQAADLETTDPQQALAIYQQSLDDHPNDFPAMIGIARIHLQQGDLTAAKEWLDKLQARGFMEPEAEKVKAQYDLATFDSSHLDELVAAVEKDPDSIPTRLELAKARMAAQQYPQACDDCLVVVEQDRGEGRDQAKTLMLDMFRVWEDQEAVRHYRRQLSMKLY